MELDEHILLVTFTAGQWIDFSIEAGQMSKNKSEFTILLKAGSKKEFKKGVCAGVVQILKFSLSSMEKSKCRVKYW